MPLSRSSRGQSVAEYSLAGALVALLCLPAVYLVSKSFSGSLPLLKSSLPFQKQANSGGLMAVTYTGSATVQGYAASNSFNNGNGATSLPTVNLSFTTSHGNHIQLDNLLPSSIPRAVETSGTNGATQVLASTMAQLASQLLAAGEITPKQYNALNLLAKQGHEIARIQALIEAAASQKYAGSPQEQSQAFLAQVVQYNGKSVTIEALSQQIGYQQQPPQGQGQKYNSATSFSNEVMDPDLLHANLGPYPATREFLKLYNSLEKTGALANPQVKEIVTSLSSQIALLAETANQATSTVIMGTGNSQDITRLESSLLSHANSQTLCGTTGGVKDNGIHCGN